MSGVGRKLALDGGAAVDGYFALIAADLKRASAVPKASDSWSVLQLRDVIGAIESGLQPIIMAMRGMALGGSLESAPAGQCRIAADRDLAKQPLICSGTSFLGGYHQHAPLVRAHRKWRPLATLPRGTG